MPKLEELTRPELIFPHLAGDSADTVLRQMADRLADAGDVRDANVLHQKLMEREQLGSTGVGRGVAIPHCKLNELQRVLVAIGMADNGVDFGAVDNQPVRLFFLVISPSKAPAEHLQCLASISKWVKMDRHVDRILELGDGEAIFQMIRQEGS